MEAAASPRAESEAVDLRYELTEEENVAALGHLRQPSNGRMILQITYGVVFLLLAASSMPEDPRAMRFGLAIAGVCYLVFTLLGPRIWRERVMAIHKKSPRSGPVAVRLDAEGLHTETPVSRGRLCWDAFTHYRVLERPHRMLVLFRGRYEPFAIPRRACGNEAEWLALIQLAGEHIGETSERAGHAFPVQPAEAAEAV